MQDKQEWLWGGGLEIAQNIGCLWKCNPHILFALGSGANTPLLYRGGFAVQLGRRRRAIPWDHEGRYRAAISPADEVGEPPAIVSSVSSVVNSASFGSIIASLFLMENSTKRVSLSHDIGKPANHNANSSDSGFCFF